VNAKHCRDFLTACAACDPGSDYGAPQALVAAVAEALPEGEWEAAVRAGDPSALRLALRACGDLTAARGVLSRLLDLPAESLAKGPRPGLSWVEARWDAKDGRWVSARAGDDGSRARPFRAAAFGEPAGRALADFSGLAPVAEVRTVPGSPGWTLVLERPLAWPLFLRCDVSAAFAPRAAQLSLILRDARLVALDFDGEALWARFVG
jgi:hypothetical protein